MALDKRRQVAERIIALLRAEGYVRTGGEINRETGECRINLVGEDDSMWINIRDAPPSLLAEFCNVYEEIHALGFGLIHSCIRLRPLGYSEIAKEDLSPELKRDLETEYHYYKAAFWVPRIVVALAILVATGSLETVGHLLGW
jgi:hypothetical protein